MVTSAKPPRSRFGTITSREKRSGLPFHRKSYTNLSSCSFAQGGISSSDPTYHILDNARALRTNVLPLKDKVLCLQDLRQVWTASIRGSQFASSIPTFPIKIPSTLILVEVQLIATGPSTWSLQEPSHNPSHLPRFNLAPDPFPKPP